MSKNHGVYLTRPLRKCKHNKPFFIQQFSWPSTYKVDIPYLVTFLDVTFKFELCVVWCGPKNIQHEDMRIKEIELHVIKPNHFYHELRTFIHVTSKNYEGNRYNLILNLLTILH